MIEIDLGVRRRSRTMGGGSLSNDMVGVTVDRELPRNEEEEEEEEDADEDTEEVDSSQEEGEYQVDEVDGERIVSAASIQGLDHADDSKLNNHFIIKVWTRRRGYESPHPSGARA